MLWDLAVQDLDTPLDLRTLVCLLSVPTVITLHIYCSSWQTEAKLVAFVAQTDFTATADTRILCRYFYLSTCFCSIFYIKDFRLS